MTRIVLLVVLALSACTDPCENKVGKDLCACAYKWSRGHGSGHDAALEVMNRCYAAYGEKTDE
tara:strand:+ start:786 stop:974 length:189 start_codon:yes stop_codon:yes gene_type:complete